MKTIYRHKNKNRDCESSKKFHENKMRPVFSAFGNEKQKFTPSVVSRFLIT